MHIKLQFQSILVNVLKYIQRRLKTRVTSNGIYLILQFILQHKLQKADKNFLLSHVVMLPCLAELLCFYHLSKRQIFNTVMQ